MLFYLVCDYNVFMHTPYTVHNRVKGIIFNTQWSPLIQLSVYTSQCTIQMSEWKWIEFDGKKHNVMFSVTPKKKNQFYGFYCIFSMIWIMTIWTNYEWWMSKWMNQIKFMQNSNFNEKKNEFSLSSCEKWS